MCNPIIVFVNPDALKTNLGRDFDFPHPVLDDNKSPCLILLNDKAPLPPDPPFEGQGHESILIVKHRGSQRHPKPDEELRVWYSDVPRLVCETFSNVRSDVVYEQILRAVESPKEAFAFAKRCRQVSHLEELEGLAAICQLRRIDSNAAEDKEVRRLRRKILSRFDRQFKTCFTSKYCTAKTDEAWQDVFTLVKKKAEEIV